MQHKTWVKIGVSAVSWLIPLIIAYMVNQGAPAGGGLFAWILSWFGYTIPRMAVAPLLVLGLVFATLIFRALLYALVFAEGRLKTKLSDGTMLALKNTGIALVLDAVFYFALVLMNLASSFGIVAYATSLLSVLITVFVLA